MEIVLVPFGNVDLSTLEFLELVLPDTLAVPCRLVPAPLGIAGAFNRERLQYESTQLLVELASRADSPSRKFLGVADVDLFIPILTFVFGEAQMNAQCAVLSVFRLRQEFYGLPPDPALFLERCEKEALHELGHTFGLVHCPAFHCVMHYSNSIGQVDLKGGDFCGDCRRQIGALHR